MYISHTSIVHALYVYILLEYVLMTVTASRVTCKIQYIFQNVCKTILTYKVETINSISKHNLINDDGNARPVMLSCCISWRLIFHTRWAVAWHWYIYLIYTINTSCSQTYKKNTFQTKEANWQWRDSFTTKDNLFSYIKWTRCKCEQVPTVLF